MKLRSVYISSFGNLKDFSLSLNDGLNTVKEENGWGKSTLATFIKCAFYGINDGSRSVTDNERKKYRPWNSTEKFGGNLVFCLGDKTYRIERYFGNKQSEDTVRLFDDETGREFADNKNLGERLFEMDEDGFFSTTYLSQKDLEIKSNSSLTAKFNSDGESDAEKSFEKALSAVETKKKRYKADRGNSGIIADLTADLYRKDDEIDSAKESAVLVSNLKTRLAELEERETELKAESGRLAGLLKESGRAEALRLKRDNLNAYSEELKETVDKEKSYNSVLCGHDVADADLSACGTGITELRALTLKKAEIESRIAAKPAVKENKTAVITFLPFIISALVVCLGIAFLFAVSVVAGACIFALGVLVAGIYAPLFIKAKKKRVGLTDTNGSSEENELKAVSIKIDEYTKGLENFFSRFNAGEGSFDLKLERIVSAALGRAETRKKAEKLEKKITELSEELEKSSESAEKLDGIKIREEFDRTNGEFNAVTGDISRSKAQISFNEDRAERLSVLREERDGIVCLRSIRTII